MASDITNNQILIAAQAIEMVYVPRGPFRAGDGQSAQGFEKALKPVLAPYDLVNPTYDIRSSSGEARLAADRLNENNVSVRPTVSSWVGKASEENWWLIDFGEGNEKSVAYFGVNGNRSQLSYYPEEFVLEGSNNELAAFAELWRGNGKDNWVMAPDAYPAEKAIMLERAKPYRYYRIRVEAGKMHAGYPIVNTIALAEANIDSLVDRTVLIDAPTTLMDSLKGLAALDGKKWTGTLPATFPNGYKGFFAMKYEISQEQYVRFLNKLSYKQQVGLLGQRVETLKVQDYVFGDPSVPSWRNGIVIAEKPENLPIVFANNLNAADDIALEADGQTIACNYMSIEDMLAYADWAGLRPLTELEYEKMCRAPYPYLPQKGEYAWGTLHITQGRDLGSSAGKVTEAPSVGNAQYGNEQTIGGPLRSGAFATGSTNREQAGAGYSGAMELSGNLAEIYYNVNNQGITLLLPESYSGGVHKTAHGDGYLDVNGKYNGYRGNNLQWSRAAAAFAVRGGSFMSDSTLLAVSDRTLAVGALASADYRDSTLSFRLGHSVPDGAALVSYIELENGTSTRSGHATDAIFRSVKSYKLAGNKPEGAEGACTYLWYIQENGGAMRLLDGENEKSLIFTGFRDDTISVQSYIFKRKVVTPFSDSEASSQYQAQLYIKRNLIQNGNFRCWADGTYARSAEEYRRPAPPYEYSGATGSGIYRIDPDGAGPIEPYDVYCDMETDGGGWMLAGKFSNEDAKHWCAAKEYWTDKQTFGDGREIVSPADAKTPVWGTQAVRTLMFQTLGKTGKAFKTTTALKGAPLTLSAYFSEALVNFPNLQSDSCYQVLNISFINASYTDFPWIDAGSKGFRSNRITIARSDKDDTQGVISGYYWKEEDADFGLGSLEDAAFNIHPNQSDVGQGGGPAASNDYSVLLFVK